MVKLFSRNQHHGKITRHGRLATESNSLLYLEGLKGRAIRKCPVDIFSELAKRREGKEKAAGRLLGKNGQIDHLIPEQIDHRFRFKMTT